MFLETLYRIYSIAGYNIAHVDVTTRLCEEHNIRYQEVDRVEAVVNWLETQYPSPAFPARREDNVGDPGPGSTRYYSAYGVVKRVTREFIWDFDEEAGRIRGIVPGLPIAASQFERLITSCRDLEREPSAATLIQLTLKR